jgi:ABC-type nitrate/sulfonate/bicarbonate transport system permease component
MASNTLDSGGAGRSVRASRQAGHRGARDGVARLLTSLGGVTLFFLVWSVMARLLPPSRLASPLAAFNDIWRNFFLSPRLGVFGLGRVGYLDLMMYTTRNILVGLALGGAVGIALGALSAKLRWVRLVVDPIVLVLGTVPVLIAAPLFLLWFGVVPFTQILLVAFYSAVMMALFSQKAVENLDPIYERAAMTVGAGLPARLRFVLAPGALPEIVGGLRISLASAWGLETFAEILGAPSGIGQAIKALVNVNNVPGMMACVSLVAATAIASDYLIVLAARRINRWA